MTRRISLVAVAGLAVLAMTASAAFAAAGPVPTADVVNRAATAPDNSYGPDKPDAATHSLPTEAPFDLLRRSAVSVTRDPDDSRFRIDATGDATSDAAPVSVTGGTDIEWQQIGIGFGIGLVLAFGLYLAMRLTRSRELAR